MWKPRASLWLEIVINFLHLIFVSPFKIHYDPSKDSSILSSSAANKFVTGGLHFVGVIFTLCGIYANATQLSIQNPKCIFHSAVSYSRYIIYYTLLLTLWSRRPYVDTFFSSSLTTTEYAFNKKKIVEIESSSNVETKVKLFTWLSCILMIPFALIVEVVNFIDVSSFSDYLTKSFPKGAGAVLNIFGLRSSGIVSSVLPNMTTAIVELTDFEYWFTVAHNIVGNYIRVCNNCALLFCIFAALTIYQEATTFVKSVEFERDQERVIEQYVDYCRFGSKVNKMCGWIVLGTAACSPPFFVVYFIGTFTNWEYTGPRVILYSGLYCCLFVIAAEAASKIGEFKEWIIEYGEGDNESQMFAMFVEVSQNPMGLRGLECFTITYGFISKMFALIVTFTIILLQFETTPVNAITNTSCE